VGADLPVAVIAVAGMAFEARIAARRGTRVICGNGNAHALAGTLAGAIGDDCHGLISFGVAGGLSPHLRAGSCVVGSNIFSGTTRFATDRGWAENLLQAIPGAVHGGIVGVPAPVAHPDAKHALHARTGAIAVDMESHVVASVAAARGLPMAAIRVITDSALCALPACALAAMRPDGTISVVAMIRSILKAPGELPMLLRTARDALMGGLALHRSRHLLGATFALPDCGLPVQVMHPHSAEERTANLLSS
jgi:adenosylhomocysteine nucleosidase